jgi:DNA-binding Lrp family transcriptional regulator
MKRGSLPLPFDKLDHQIIMMLNEDARMSAAEMEKRTGTNQRTIRKRLNRLLEMGALRLKGIVDPRVFGYGISVDIFVAIEPGKEDTALAALSGLPPISYLATGPNADELSVEARFQDFEAMDDFFKVTLPSIDGVSVNRFTMVPRIIKNIDSWLPSPELFSGE